MELDEFKQAWQTLDRRLEKQHAMQFNIFRDRKLSKLKLGLLPLISGQAIQIVVGVLVMLVVAPFWVEHRAVPHLLLYGLLLHAFGLMFVAFGARELFLISRIHYAAPVLEIQKQLAALRAWRLRSRFWFEMVGCFIWVPLLLVVFYWVGADLWVHQPQMVAWFTFSGGIAVALSYGLIVWSRHPKRTAFKKSLDDSTVGGSVRRAQAMLDEIAEFERS